MHGTMAGDVPKAASYCFSVGVTDRHGGLSLRFALHFWEGQHEGLFLRVIVDYPRRRWMDGFNPCNPRNPFHLRSRQWGGTDRCLPTTAFLIPACVHLGDHVVDGGAVGLDISNRRLHLIEQGGNGRLCGVEREVVAVALAADELNAR